MIHHDLLGLPGGVVGDQDDNADGHAADHGGVVLEEPVVANRPSEFELLVLIKLAGGDDDRTDVLRAVRAAVHRRGLQSDVVREVV